MRGARVCASHAGLCGGQEGNRNALRHGLYSKLLSDEEKLDLLEARAIEGLDEEIAITRLMILRALRLKNPPAVDYARLAEALCRQLRLQRQLSGQAAESLVDSVTTVIDELHAARSDE
jgi:hypothetical protein